MILRLEPALQCQIGRIPTARVAAVVKYHTGGLRLTALASRLSVALSHLVRLTVRFSRGGSASHQPPSAANAC
jgi:hypothetical protein